MKRAPETIPGSERPIHYVDEGHGPTTVVMLHCLGCNLHYWDVPAADLSRDHRVVRIDFPKHGTVDSFAKDVRTVVDRARVGRFILVGHSMSGTVALETAAELGNRVLGIIPVDSVLDVDVHIPSEQRAQLVAKVRSDYRGVIEHQLHSLMPENPSPTVVARVRADALAMNPADVAETLDSLLAYREDETLDRLRVPVIAIDADRRPLALEHNRAHAPQFDARIIPATGHWLMFDKPAEFTATLRAIVTSMDEGVHP